MEDTLRGRTLRKVAALALGAALLAPAVAPAGAAYAGSITNNHQDTPIAATTIQTGGGAYKSLGITASREKRDDSFMYCYANRTVVLGTMVQGVWSTSSSNWGYTRQRTEYFPGPYAVYVGQMVYEDGYRSGSLLFSSDTAHTPGTHWPEGVWSPDSI